MNILGVGTWEFVVVILIMLIVAGPKRMIHWMYILGRYVGKLRIMWSETVEIIQKEFDDAGFDVQLPKEPPTRKSLNKMAAETLKPFTDPLQEALNEVEAEAKSVRSTFQETINEVDAEAKSINNTMQEIDMISKADGSRLYLKDLQPPTSETEKTEKENKTPAPDFGTWSDTGNKTGQ
jgi:Sec-independent protein translocase protein TatA